MLLGMAGDAVATCASVPCKAAGMSCRVLSQKHQQQLWNSASCVLNQWP